MGRAAKLIVQFPLRQTRRVLKTWSQFRSLYHLPDMSAIIHTSTYKAKTARWCQDSITINVPIKGQRLQSSAPSHNNQFTCSVTQGLPETARKAIQIGLFMKVSLRALITATGLTHIIRLEKLSE